MFFSWFDAKKSKQFGEFLAEFYLERLAAEKNQRSAKIVKAKRVELLGKLQLQIRKFTSENKLNVYKKAALSNAFQWKLRDSGLEREHIDELLAWLTKVL
jgi:hypothetical protein